MSQQLRLVLVLVRALVGPETAPPNFLGLSKCYFYVMSVCKK